MKKLMYKYSKIELSFFKRREKKVKLINNKKRRDCIEYKIGRKKNFNQKTKKNITKKFEN